MSMKEIKAKYLGNIYQTSKDGYDGAIFSPRYISRTLTAKNSGGVLIYETNNKIKPNRTENCGHISNNTCKRFKGVPRFGKIGG